MTLSQDDFDETLKEVRDGVIQRLDQIVHLRKQWVDTGKPSELGQLLHDHLDALERESRILDRLQQAYQAIIATNGLIALAAASRGADDQAGDEKPVGGYQ